MSFEYFISKRILKKEVEGNKVSRPIVRISIISISLAVVVNLITLAVVTGFQHEVREKVSGFGSHILIMNSGEENTFESEPINKDQAFLQKIKNISGIKNIQSVAYKPVLFQSAKNNITYKLSNGKDTSQTQQEIQGAIIKGVGKDFDFSFFKSHLIKGRLPDINSDSLSNELLISSRLANDLNFKIGDNINAFFVKKQPIKRKFTVCGIYSTGLEEFDKKMVIGDIKVVQKLNEWGIQTSILIEDTLSNGSLIVKANVIGGNGNYRYNWGKGYENYQGFTIYPTKDTLIKVVVSDYWTRIDGQNEKTSLADSAYLSIKIKGEKLSPCDFKLNSENEIDKNYLDEIGNYFSLKCSNKEIYFKSIEGLGTYQKYINGFEINVKEWEKLPTILKLIKQKIEFIPTEHNEELKVSSIIDNQSDIFLWLDFLDLNVYIILILMLLIGIINMGSALLVLILVRTNFIGMLKSMGAKNWSIRKIFLYQGAFLIGRGMLWGNLIGLTFCFLQSQFGIFKLNPEVYYLSKVPIELSFFNWMILNIGTLIICVLALIIPSYVITRVNPVKAIKFN